MDPSSVLEHLLVSLKSLDTKGSTEGCSMQVPQYDEQDAETA